MKYPDLCDFRDQFNQAGDVVKSGYNFLPHLTGLTHIMDAPTAGCRRSRRKISFEPEKVFTQTDEPPWKRRSACGSGSCSHVTCERSW